MTYLSPTALRNLKHYTYKTVDEFVHPSPHQLELLVLTAKQVSCIPILSWPLLELVHYSLATDHRAQHGTFSIQSINIGRTDVQCR